MQRIARVMGCLSLCGVLVACGGDDTDPKNAKSTSLHGYWVHAPEESPGSFVTVMGFFPGDKAKHELGYVADSDVSAIWSTATQLSILPTQVATYRVTSGFLEQTALADVIGGVGATYRTELFEVDSGRSLTVESSKDPSGKRRYEFADRCPIEGPSGFASIKANICDSYFETATALAFDARGKLHYTLGYAAPGNDPTCVTLPVYGVLGDACTPVRYETPNLLASSLDVFEGKIFHAYQVSDWNITLRTRDLDAEQWETQDLGLASHTPLGLWVFAGERDVVVVSSGYEESQIRWRSGKYTAVAPVDEQGTPIPGQIIAASRAPEDGALGILMGGNAGSDLYIAEEGATRFKKIELPRRAGLGWGGGLNLLSKTHAYLGVVDGNVGSNPGGVGGQVLGGNGYFMEWQDDKWTEHSLGLSSMVLLPQRTREKFFVHTTGKSMRPELYFGRIVEAGGGEPSTVWTLAPAERPSVAGGSPESFRQPAFAVGPNNELAYTFEGGVISVHRDDQPWAKALEVVKQK